jgi:hypothetical protein
MSKNVGRPLGSKQKEKRYAVYNLTDREPFLIGKFKTFEAIAKKLDLTTDQCQNLYYKRSKKWATSFLIEKLY